MPSIELRSKNTWRLTVEAGYGPNKKRLRERKTIEVEDPVILKSPKKLKEYLNDELLKFKIEVEAGTYISPEKTTFEAFVEEWRQKYAENELAPLTLKTYNHHLANHILPALGHMRLDQIQTMHLVTFINELRKPAARKDGKAGPLASGTIEYIYRVTKNVLSRAADWKIIKVNPMIGVPKPKVEEKEVKFLSEDDAQIVVQKLYDGEPEVWRLFCLGAMIGGFRRGELLGFEWSDVDFENNTFSIHRSISLTKDSQAVIKGPKNKSSKRIVSMPEWYMAELKEYQKEWKKNYWDMKNKWQGGDRQVVFHAGYGKPFYHTQPTKWWTRFLSRHGLEHITFHGLRHSSATLLIEDENNHGSEVDSILKAVQKRLGHSTFQTTADIYAHVTKKKDKKMAEKFDKFNQRIPSPIRPQRVK